MTLQGKLLFCATGTAVATAALAFCAERPTSSAATANSATAPARIKPDAYPHLHNLVQASPSIYTGGEPEQDAAFVELVKLGVKTVISVDGARPNVEAAA